MVVECASLSLSIMTVTALMIATVAMNSGYGQAELQGDGAKREA